MNKKNEPLEFETVAVWDIPKPNDELKAYATAKLSNGQTIRAIRVFDFKGAIIVQFPSNLKGYTRGILIEIEASILKQYKDMNK